MKRIFITGTAGFIGYHLANTLLEAGDYVHGFDGMTDYYDVTLKERRHELLHQHPNFSATIGRLENAQQLHSAAEAFRPNVIIHLAAQAGVRYSLENPRAYIDSNIVGTFNVLEAARLLEPEHLLMASTSSVYGANTDMPFSELDKADTPLTMYAATKKANESMAHCYAHLWNLPTTMFRFFTVYGPWGRPDLALFKFVDAMLDDRPIDIYNHGQMYRDFTYVTDLAKSIQLLVQAAPETPKAGEDMPHWDNLSPVAPFRVVNIGNTKKVRLLEFVDAIEDELGVSVRRNYMDMQKGDVPATWANTDALFNLTGYRPDTDYKVGISLFINWFREYYGK